MRKALHQLLATIIVAGMVHILAAGRSHSATITVMNLNDSGSGSLRDAILSAASGDTIQFSVSGSITLGSELPVIATNLTIDGGSSVTISGNNSFTDFTIGPGAVVTLDDLTIANGHSSLNGGGIFDVGTLTIENSVLTGNSAVNGGGVFVGAGGTLTVLNSILENNTATTGGGIYNNGTVILANSIFTNDHATVDNDIHNNGVIETVTPLPAALPLFATGLGGLGLLGWRRKRKAQAVA